MFRPSSTTKDEKYINLAAAAGAAYIISRDANLLDLMTSFNDESKNFRQKFRPLKVIEPLEFLKIGGFRPNSRKVSIRNWFCV